MAIVVFGGFGKQGGGEPPGCREVRLGEAAESGGEFRDQLRGKLGRLLEAITGGAVRALDDLGIVPKMERGRQPFEQEAPGRARLSQWPFYA